MKIFITGTTGFIGGSLAETLRDQGHELTGLVRSSEKAEWLRGRGIEPVLGTLDDAEVLAAAAQAADATIDTADADHAGGVKALVAALRGTGKTLIHTSGSSVVSDYAKGGPGDEVFDEETPRLPIPEKAPRVAIDRFVQDVGASARLKLRTVVICPTLIYGRGRGLHKESVQVPRLVARSRKDGVARHVGEGRNIWSNVHIDDLVDLYVLALEKAESGSFFFAENGEASMRQVAEAIASALGLGRVEGLSVDDAIAEWGREMAVLGLASNSRVRAVRARERLGWAPSRPGLLEDFANSF